MFQNDNRERSTVIDLFTSEERGTRGNIITTFKFLSGFDDGKIEQFFEFGRNLSGIGDNSKLCNRRVRKD